MGIGQIIGQAMASIQKPESLNKEPAEKSVAHEIKDADPPNDFGMILSNDERVADDPSTPKPVPCEYCGAPRYTKGLMLTGSPMWMPYGPERCTCPEAVTAHERAEAERLAKVEAERKEEEDRKMRDRVKRVIGESGMGERFLQRTFKTYIADTPDRKKILAAAVAYAQGFDKKLPKRGEPLPGRNGFLITGTKGTGKTHIAAAIANHLLNKGMASICMTERELFGRIKKTYSRDGDEGEVLEIYKSVPLLVIDDLGKEKPTDWTISTLYAIIDGRYDRSMPLIVTANYDAKNLVARITPAGADETTAEAIIDRLAEMCEGIVMTGESWRTKK